ncbi:MAG: response regulator, partial [Chitinophagaceae bacterium]|nr:response regulator [Chitinophagaceae bacterium]
HALALSYFLENSNIVSEIGGDASSAIAALENKQINCVILDMGITDARCFNTIKEIKANPGMENIPVVIFTEKNLSKSEELHIKQYADSIVVKTAHSYRRILDEISLFLHLVEKNANANEQSASYQKLGFLKEVLKNKTALIADDDVRNIFSLAKALESVGMTVLSAMDGREALEQLIANPGIDIILMDMMMPEMDGYEAMKRIREMEGYAHLPIIAVTAKAMREDREKCIRSGASDYITKPIDADQLLSLLRVWLYNKS